MQEYIFGIDIIIIFFSEYKDMETGFYCREPKNIATNYLKKAFIIDFLAFFPFFEVLSNLTSHGADEKEYDFLHFVYLLRLLRLYKA